MHAFGNVGSGAQTYTDAQDLANVRRATVTSASQLAVHTHFADGTVRDNPLFDGSDDDKSSSAKVLDSANAADATATVEAPVRRPSEASMNDYVPEFDFPPPPPDDEPLKKDDVGKPIDNNNSGDTNAVSNNPDAELSEAEQLVALAELVRRKSFTDVLPLDGKTCHPATSNHALAAPGTEDYIETDHSAGLQSHVSLDSSDEDDVPDSDLYITAEPADAARSKTHHATLRRPPAVEAQLDLPSPAPASSPGDRYEEFVKLW